MSDLKRSTISNHHRIFKTNVQISLLEETYNSEKSIYNLTYKLNGFFNISLIDKYSSLIKFIGVNLLKNTSSVALSKLKTINFLLFLILMLIKFL